MISKKKLFGSVAIAAVLAGAAVAAAGLRPLGSANGAVASGSVPPRASIDLPMAFATEPRSRSSWEKGAERVYEFDLASTLDADSNAGGEPFMVTLSGKLKLIADAVGPERMFLQASLFELALVFGDEQTANAEFEKRLLGQLSKPFGIDMTTAGRIDFVLVDRDVQGFAQALVGNLVSRLSFVEPLGENPSYREWETEESDQTGVYRARYKRLGSETYEKRKLDYSRVALFEQLGDDSTGRRIELDATTRFERTLDGLIRHVEARERLRMPFGNAAYATETSVTATLSTTGRSSAAPLDRRNLGKERLYEARAAGGDVDGAIERKRKLVNGRTFTQLVEELRHLPEDANDARLAAADTLQALFELDPDSLDQAVRHLRSRDLPEPDADALLGAVAAAGSPRSQATLGAIAEDAEADSRIRSAAVTHLGFERSPTPDTFESLERLAQSDLPELEQSATLALGGAARGGVTGDEQAAAAAKRAIRGLSTTATSGATTSDRIVSLHALGNSASVDALAAIRSAFADPEPAVRAAAAAALRFVSVPEADELIARALVGDAEPMVRSAAVRAANERAWSDFWRGVCAQALAAETVESIRLGIAGLLAGNLETDPGVRQLLEAQLKVELFDMVRAFIEERLDPAFGSSGR
jgi:hypothetical protein